jgi:cytochrome c-type biogenesis protein CcmH/NrfG
MAGAAESFRRVTRLNPSEQNARVRLAAAYAATGDPNRALLTLEDGFASEPGLSGAAANNIAWSLHQNEQMGDVALALARYATEKLPSRPEPWDTLGAVYLARGDASRAVAAFEKSVKLAPEKKEYRDRLNEAKRRAASH